MQLVTRHMESKIKKVLPHCFAVVFDGWSTGRTHCVGVFGTYRSDSVVGYDKVWLWISPMEDETSQSTKEHFRFLVFVLDVYYRKLSTVATIIGDKNSTNITFSRMVCPNFTGCDSHCFKQVVKDILDGKKDQIHKSQAIMKKLSCSISSNLLRRLIPLSAKHENCTRWSSTYHMLCRYCQLCPFRIKKWWCRSGETAFGWRGGWYGWQLFQAFGRLRFHYSDASVR